MATADRGRGAGRARSPEHTERLTARVERLQVSLARLAVLRAAAAEVKHSLDAVSRRGTAQVTRVAAVDLGTNSTRLLVADVDDGRVEEVVRRSVVTRLGEGVDARRRLLPVPVARVRNVAHRLPARARGARRRAHARRRDERGARRRERRGVPRRGRVVVRLQDEAALGRRGGAADAPRGRRRSTLGRSLLDVGGGSTELIDERLRDEPRHRLRAPDRALPARRPTDAARAGPRQAAVGQLLPALDVTRRARRRGHGRPARRAREAATRPRRCDRRRSSLDGLAASPLEERRRVDGLDPGARHR